MAFLSVRLMRVEGRIEKGIKRKMDKETFLATLRQERVEWDALLAQVPASRMTTPGIEGQWSVKDVIAHIATYEEWTAVELLKALAISPGSTITDFSSISSADVHVRNARIFEQHQAKSLIDVQEYSQKAFTFLLEAVEYLSDDDLLSTDALNGRLEPFWAGRPLWKGLASNSYSHYHEHIPLLQNWLKQQ